VIQGLKTTTGFPPGEDFIGAGTREIQNSISLDGISIVNNLITNTPSRPMPDAIQELEVQTGTYSAQYGAYMGVHLNLVIKNGTNSLHGSAWEYNEPNTLAANNFFNNKAGLGNPVTHYNQYGVAAGGPVLIPKLFNGRNKLFWFFAWEGLKDSQPNTAFLSVPTDKERMGDFSDLLKLGSQYQLYDPATAVLNGTTITRSPFPNNIIPANRLNPIALNYLKFIPGPNTAGQPLLSENYYLERALGPFTEVRRGSASDLLRREIAVLVYADAGPDSPAEEAAIKKWVEGGGLLLRFAGPRLAEYCGEVRLSLGMDELEARRADDRSRVQPEQRDPGGRRVNDRPYRVHDRDQVVDALEHELLEGRQVDEVVARRVAHHERIGPAHLTPRTGQPDVSV